MDPMKARTRRGGTETVTEHRDRGFTDGDEEDCWLWMEEQTILNHSDCSVFLSLPGHLQNSDIFQATASCAIMELQILPS